MNVVGLSFSSCWPFFFPKMNTTQRKEKCKIDPAWEHCEETGVSGTVICNWCREAISGGVYRMKFHLAKLPGNNVRPCKNVDVNIERKFKTIVEEIDQNKEIRKKTKLHQGRGISIGDDTTATGSFCGSASTLNSTGHAISTHPPGSSNAIRCDFFAPRGQHSLDASWHKEKYAEARKAMANFWYYSDIPFNVASSPYWEYMIRAVASCGPGLKATTYNELKGNLLEDAVADCKKIIDEQKNIWKKKGCSILSDGWTDQAGRTLLNFLVSSSGGLVFLKSVDASSQVKTGEYLAGLLKSVIEEVGPENVVQVITDNAANYVKAGEIIKKEFPTIFWTPCAAHVLNLLLEDIGKVDWVKEIVEKGRIIPKYINNHAWVLNLMRTKFTNGKNLIRPGATRFASSILTLQCIHTHRLALKQMLVSDEWTASRYAREPDGKYVVQIVFDEDYWTQCDEFLKITEPLMKVLRLVDSDAPTMGYLYEAMDRAKEAISQYFSHDQRKFGYIWDIVDKRWSKQLHKPLHGAGLFLNPKFFFSDSFDDLDGEVNESFHMAIHRLVPDQTIRQRILNVDLQDYKRATGFMFSSAECKSARKTLAPHLWWETYGGKAPNLQKVAIIFLSQPVSASGCERNWSTFSNIHTKKRNRLTQERLNDLVFVHYNLRLQNKNIEGSSSDAIDLDGIDNATDAWDDDDAPVPNQDQDFHITFDEFQRMEEEAVAMAEEESRAAMVTDVNEESESPLAEGPSGSTVHESQQRDPNVEEEIADDTPLLQFRSRAAKERSRKGKHATGA